MSSSSQHPNIVKYKGFVKSSTHLHIILECVVLSVTLFHSRRRLTDGHSVLSFLVGLCWEGTARTAVSTRSASGSVGFQRRSSPSSFTKLRPLSSLLQSHSVLTNSPLIR